MTSHSLGNLKLFAHTLSNSLQFDQCQIFPSHDRFISSHVAFLNTFQLLGVPSLKPLIETYEACTYQGATYAQILAFMSALMNLDLAQQADLTTRNVLATVLSVQVFLRDQMHQPFSLRRLLEHLDLNVLTKHAIDQTLPLPIRANLDLYLKELTDFAMQHSVQEPSLFRPHMTHLAVIQPVQLLIDRLQKPSLQWIRARLDALQALIRNSAGNPQDAWQIAQELVTTNLRYQILRDDDLRALLRLRGLNPDQSPSLYRHAV